MKGVSAVLFNLGLSHNGFLWHLFLQHYETRDDLSVIFYLIRSKMVFYDTCFKGIMKWRMFKLCYLM